MTNDLVRGAVGGLLAGVVFIAITMWFSVSNGNPALMPFLLISTEILGPSAVQQGDANASLGMLIHAVQSIGFGIVFAFLVRSLRDNGKIAIAGTVYGLAVFFFTFVILAQLVPWFRAFQNANYPFEFFAHMVYGTLLSFAFFGSAERSTSAETGARTSRA